MYGTWHVFCYLGEETNPRTKFGEVEQHTLKGGNSMLWSISLCRPYSWFLVMILLLIRCFQVSFGKLYILLMFCSLINYFMFTTPISLIHEQTLTHVFSYLIGKTTHPQDWVYFHDSPYSCWNSLIHAWFDVLWYLERMGEIHGYALCGTLCVRGGPPRSQVILIDDGYIVGKRYMHVSCQFHKLLMPLHATWCSLKFPAFCPPIVKCF